MKRYHIIKPDFYDRFSCKGIGCRYTCCQGWNITLSKGEYRKIKRRTDQWTDKENQKYFQKLPPELQKKNGESAIVLNEESQCPFLTQEGLCRLQCAYGADILPGTCIHYPRSNHRYLDDVLLTLSPGCERVLELCFQERKVKLTEEDKLSGPIPFSLDITESMAARHPYLKYHNDILSLCLLLMQAEDIILENRILLLGIAARHIEDLVKEGNPAEIPEYISQYIKLLDTTADIEEMLSAPEINPLILLHNLNIASQCLTTEDRERKDMMSKIDRALNLRITQEGMEAEISFSSERYRLLLEKYQTFLKGREHYMENLMVTFLLFLDLPFCAPISTSIWDNYMYLAWTYSTVKLCLTAVMEDIRSEQDFIHYCSILMRIWSHNFTFAKKIIENFRHNETNSLAHIATLLYS